MLCFLLAFYTLTSSEPQIREWSHLHTFRWALPILIKVIRTMSYRYTQSQLDLACPSFRLSLSGDSDCIQLTIKNNHCKEQENANLGKCLCDIRTILPLLTVGLLHPVISYLETFLVSLTLAHSRFWFIKACLG